jgi:polysaccharide biosynthesis protein PslG
MRRALALAVLLPAVAAPAAVARPLAIGFYDPEYSSGDPVTRSAWFDSTKSAGAGVVRISAEWSRIAPDSRPSGFRAADPEDPHYRWGALDGAIQAATDRGLTPLVTLWHAPRWAEGDRRPKSAPPGSWRPKSGEYAKFARAAALRYRHVHHWQIWNEANLTTYLAPQYVKRHGKRRLESPGRFRALLNAAYRAIKNVDRKAVVVAGGTAPYGDPQPGGARTPPALFVRELLCLHGHALKKERCKHPAHLDALAHHPYSVGSPQRKALNTDDVAIPDLGKLRRPLRKAEKTGRVLPKRHKRLWVTEVSWDSSPPDPDGVPEKRHARWLAETFRLLWKQGVDTITWFQVRDAAPVPSFGSTYQSGVFFRDGRPKRAVRAFRFPFTAVSKGGRVALWGRAPSRGRVNVQFDSGSGWKAIAHLKASRRGAVFQKRLHSRGHGRMRAVRGGRTSLPWPVS